MSLARLAARKHRSTGWERPRSLPNQQLSAYHLYDFAPGTPEPNLNWPILTLKIMHFESKTGPKKQVAASPSTKKKAGIILNQFCNLGVNLQICINGAKQMMESEWLLLLPSLLYSLPLLVPQHQRPRHTVVIHTYTCNHVYTSFIVFQT